MKFNLFKQIALYVGILVLVVCIGLGFASYKMSSDSTISEAEKTLLLLAQEGVNNVEAVIQGHLNLLEAIANRRDISNMVWEEQLPILKRELDRIKDQGYLQLGVVSPNGIAKYVDGSEVNLGDRDHVKKAFRGESNISEVLISRVDNSAVLMYAVPIYDGEGKVGGVLVARRPGDALNNITNKMGYGREGYAYIISADGTFMSHPNREYIMEQRSRNRRRITRLGFSSSKSRFRKLRCSPL